MKTSSCACVGMRVNVISSPPHQQPSGLANPATYMSPAPTFKRWWKRRAGCREKKGSPGPERLSQTDIAPPTLTQNHGVSETWVKWKLVLFIFFSKTWVFDFIELAYIAAVPGVFDIHHPFLHFTAFSLNLNMWGWLTLQRFWPCWSEECKHTHESKVIHWHWQLCHH